MTPCTHKRIEDVADGYLCLDCGLVIPYHSDEYDDDAGWDQEDDDDEDEWLYRCGWVRGVGCTLAGSEECDFECTLRATNERGLALTRARLAKRAAQRDGDDQ